MASLVGQQLKDTYDSLLKTSDNDALGGTYKEITDGSGNGSNLYLGTSGSVGIGTSSIDGTLHLDAGTSSDLVIEKDDGGYASVRFHNAGSQVSYIQLDASEDMIYYGGSGVNQIIYAGGSERLRIDSIGTIKGIGTYTAGNSIKIFEAERLGGAVASDWSYDDATTDMSLGTSTAHSFSLKTGNTNRLTIDSSGIVQARRARSNTAGNVALSLQPSDSTIHYGFRIDSANNFLNIDRVDSAGTIMTLDPSVKVGIGTNPADILHIKQANGAQMRFENSTTGRNIRIGEGVGTTDVFSFRGSGVGTDSLSVDFANDRVGVGTITPSDKLEVAGLSNYTGLTLKGNASSRPALTFKNVNQSLLGSIYGTEGRALAFESGGDGTTGVLAMTIGSSGNVGIANTDPDHPLTVTAGPSSAGVPVAWIHNSTNSANHDGTVISSTNDGADAEVLHVRANNTTYSNGTSLMLVRGDGNVGIGGTPASISSTARWLTLNADNGSSASGGIIHQIDGTTKGAQYVFGSNVLHDAKSGVGHKFTVNNGTDSVLLDTSGNVLVGKQTTSITTVGVELKTDGNLIATRAGVVTTLNREDSDGTIIDLRKDGTTVGSIGVTSGSFAIGQTDTGIGFFNGDRIAFPATSAGAVQDSAIDLGYSSGRWKDLYLSGTAYLQEKITTASSNLKIGVDGSATSSINISSASLYPQTDGSVNLGFSASSFRFATVFATTGTINTSDEKQKQDIEELSEAELRVAQKAKTLIRKYRMISSVEEKGDDARIHVGIIAQDLEKAFADEGLDAGRYGMFIKETTTNDDGEEQTAYAIRYNELLAFIISSI